MTVTPMQSLQTDDDPGKGVPPPPATRDARAWRSAMRREATKARATEQLPDYADGAAERAMHLLDERDMTRAIRTGTLPALTFFKPIGADDQHPGYAS